MRNNSAVIIVSLLAYAVAGFAYMHSTFISKDLFKMLINKIDRIENKIDQMGEK